MTDQQLVTFALIYVGGVIFGTLWGASRGSAHLGFLWPFVFGPPGLILVYFSTGKREDASRPALADRLEQLRE